MSIANKISIKDKLDITYNILNILLKNNKMMVNKSIVNKNKGFDEVIRKTTRSPQFFCTKFCGGSINDCTCLHMTH
jgi:hypothetical protein